MALSTDLQQFKHSQVARLEVDKSQIIQSSSSTIRLIIGFSKKGPFNTPVYVPNTKFFLDNFGDVDTALERKGSYFHRTALTCLERGPIIVLNLLNLNDELDKSQFKTISTSATEINGISTFAPVSGNFNQDKFWFADRESVIRNIDSVSTPKLMNIANIGRKTISVITRKSTALGYDVLAKDWYGVGKVPEFMNENDYIKDYILDVIVIEGDFSDYTALSIDPIFGDYFTPTGLKKTYIDTFGNSKDGLTSFLALNQVNVVGVYTGSIIPGFLDKNNTNIGLQDQINLDAARTGLLFAMDTERFDDEYLSGNVIDTVGHTIESDAPSIIDFLSYYGTPINTINYTEPAATLNTFAIAATAGQTGSNAYVTASSTITSLGVSGLYENGQYDTIIIPGPASTYITNGTVESSLFSTQAEFETWKDSVAIDKTYLEVGSTGVATSVTYTVTSAASKAANEVTIKISLTCDTDIVGPSSTSVGHFFIDGLGITAGGTSAMNLLPSIDFTYGDSVDVYAGKYSELYQDNLSGLITDGDQITINGATGSTYGYATFTTLATNDMAGATWNGYYSPATPVLSKNVNYVRVDAWEDIDFLTAVNIDSDASYNVKTYSENANESLVAYGSYTNPTTTIYFDNTSSGPLGASGFNGKVRVGQYLVSNFGGTAAATKIDPATGKSRLTRVISVSEDKNPLSTNYGIITVKTNEPVFVSDTNEVERYKTIEDFADHYRFHVLKGYTLRPEHMPNGTVDRQNEILDIMFDTNIKAALVDKELVTYRYIIDSFSGGIEPSSKARLSSIAKERKNAFAILNMPSIKEFKESTNPLFKASPTSLFDPIYIASGGNLELNPDNVFSLPGIADGSNFCAFYGPNLLVRENGVTISVPPSAYISNLYIDKMNLGQPYSIVAGPRRGVVSGKGVVGVEYPFDAVALDSIEPFGYNSILNKKGFGLVINSNQTAQQNIKSALSQAHVRELLIYIEDGIADILSNYRWEFNTAQNRLEIKTLADAFINQVLNDGGVYDFQNVMDSTNNTAEVIDNNIGILDTYIEPVRGMGILVHRTTILKTGSISAGQL